jgi:ComF family protein
MMKLKSWIGAFFDVFYPRICPGCQESLRENERIVCAHCRYELPLTNFGDTFGNPVEKLFWGRAHVAHASSMYYFLKSSRIQHLIHSVKYKSRRDLGHELGLWMGHAYHKTVFAKTDLLVPVPLHPKKERERGYNQSSVLAGGIAEVLKIPVLENALQRTNYTQTQTHKGRYERWENVDGLFTINPKINIAGKHVLLIDDVITTGATLEACCNALQRIPEVKVSILTFAKA